MRRGVTLPFAVRRGWQEALNWIFPNDEDICRICTRPIHSRSGSVQAVKSSDSPAFLPQLSDALCPFCLQELQLCASAGRSEHIQLRLPGGRTVPVASCIQYDAFIRTLFRSFKYDGLMELAPFFGHLLVRRLHGDSLPHTDCIVPVPTTLERTRKRGYDHVQLLAAHLSSQTRQPIRRALVRLTDERGFTQSQSAKNAVERRRGLERVYTLNRQVPIRGCRILLIDDIATTGATLAACSEKLYLAGAQNVCALVVARVR